MDDFYEIDKYLSTDEIVQMCDALIEGYEIEEELNKEQNERKTKKHESH